MAWTTPRTWVNDEIVGETIMNTHVRDNLNYLISSRAQIYKRAAGNYTTTSGTPVDVDGTNLALTLTCAGTRLLVLATGVVKASLNGTTVHLYLALDGTDGPQMWLPLNQTTLTQNMLSSFCIVQVFTVTAGSHTVKLRWTTNQGTATMSGDGTYPMSMIVAEVG